MPNPQKGSARRRFLGVADVLANRFSAANVRAEAAAGAPRHSPLAATTVYVVCDSSECINRLKSRQRNLPWLDSNQLEKVSGRKAWLQRFTGDFHRILGQKVIAAGASISVRGMALEDAMFLARKLIAKQASADAFRAFEWGRRERVDRVIRQAQKNGERKMPNQRRQLGL